VNDVNIHYLRTGGSKPPVVLLHGLMTSGACWTPVARALEKDYDVIMPDSRGHGNSSAPEQGYSYNTLAVDILGLMDHLKLINPVLIGHSMGGMVAAVAASQNSQQLQGLVLADPTFLTLQRQQEVYESDITAQHQSILQRSKEEYLAKLHTRHYHRSPELIELFAQARFQTRMHAFKILNPPNPDYRQLIKTLTMPSLLVIGGVGGIISPLVAAEFAKLNQHLRVKQIVEAGHGIPYDQSERFSIVIKNFLSEILSNTR